MGTTNAERTTYTLRGLAGTEGDVEAVSARSAEDAVAGLEAGERAVTGAGNTGAINVWRVDGDFRCERYAYGVVKASNTFPTLKGAATWLAAEWPNIGDPDRMADRPF